MATDANLRVLQKNSPSIAGIHFKASNIVVYPYDEAADSWVSPRTFFLVRLFKCSQMCRLILKFGDQLLCATSELQEFSFFVSSLTSLKQI